MAFVFQSLWMFHVVGTMDSFSPLLNKKYSSRINFIFPHQIYIQMCKIHLIHHLFHSSRSTLYISISLHLSILSYIAFPAIFFLLYLLCSPAHHTSLSFASFLTLRFPSLFMHIYPCSICDQSLKNFINFSAFIFRFRSSFPDLLQLHVVSLLQFEFLQSCRLLSLPWIGSEIVKLPTSSIL